METKTIAIIVSLILAVILLVVFTLMIINGGNWGTGFIKDLFEKWLVSPSK
jgi:hypothetical protein